MLLESISFSFSQMMSLSIAEKEYFYINPQTLNVKLEKPSFSLS